MSAEPGPAAEGGMLHEVFGWALPTPARATFRGGVLALTLAGVIAFLCPVSATAGTETQVLRVVTAASLAVAGGLFVASKGRVLAFAAGLATLAGAAIATGALWLAAFAAMIGGWWALMRLARGAAAEPASDTESGETSLDVIVSVVTAFVYALVVREFAFEAFKIPTGSMEPTILGEGFGGKRIGDHLIAAKGSLYFKGPDRGSIMVFRYPLFRPTNFIKRLVGLPGELIENKDGDIYVNGKVAAKPEPVQETLWFPMLPRATGEWPRGVGAEFTPDNGGRWEFTTAGAKGSADAGKTGWIVHQAGHGDVRVTFDVDASKLGDGAIRVRLDGGGRRVELEARRDEMWLTGPGIERTRLAASGLGTGTSRLGFAVADRVVRVWRGGRLTDRIETADTENIAGKAEQQGLAVEGGSATFDGLRLEHDLQYSMQGRGRWQVPEGCYFMLGDNTNSSKDSRLWRGKVFRTTDGREFVADSEVRLDGELPVQNIRDTGTGFEFHDSYGAKRHLEKSELVGGMWKDEEQPFVRESDLVGRAMLIFMPFWPKDGEWRPRLLP